MTKVDELVKKIISGELEASAEDLELYVNNSEEIEERLREHQRRVDAL